MLFFFFKYIDLGTAGLGRNFKSTTIAIGRPDDKQNHCRNGEEFEYEELHLRKGSPFACRVMYFVNSSFTSRSSVGSCFSGDGAVSLQADCSTAFCLCYLSSPSQNLDQGRT